MAKQEQIEPPKGFFRRNWLALTLALATLPFSFLSFDNDITVGTHKLGFSCDEGVIFAIVYPNRQWVRTPSWIGDSRVDNTKPYIDWNRLGFGIYCVGIPIWYFLAVSTGWIAFRECRRY